MLRLLPGISSLLISTLPVHSPAFFQNISRFFPVLALAKTGSCVQVVSSVYKVWQKEWDETGLVSNKFHEILPKLRDKLLSFCNTRTDNTVLNRLHIVNSYLTHSFILRKEEDPVCVACNVALTVKHVLIECADMLEISKKYFEEKFLYSLFRNVNPKVVFDFLREIGVFYKV